MPNNEQGSDKRTKKGSASLSSSFTVTHRESAENLMTRALDEFKKSIIEEISEEIRKGKRKERKYALIMMITGVTISGIIAYFICRI